MRPGLSSLLASLYILLAYPVCVSAQQEVGPGGEVAGIQAEADTARKVLPGPALLRSAVLPGWGQFYTGHAIKGVAVMGVEGVFIGLALDADSRVQDLKATGASPDELGNWRDKRRKFVLWAVAVWLYSMADAYVDAHLYDFEREEPHFDIEPIPPVEGDRTAAIWLGIRIPFGKR